MVQKSWFDRFRFRCWRVTSNFRYFTLQKWEYILWGCESIILIIVIVLALRFRSQGWNNVGLLLTVLFGLISAASLILTLIVLHSIRNMITDYMQAGHTIEKEIVKNAITTIYILSENPAFLQVVRPEILDKWLRILRDHLEERQFIRVVFAYVYREELIRNKFPKWGDKLNIPGKNLAYALKGNYTFSLCANTMYRPKVFLIPLLTTNIPFYLAVTDFDKKGMFCRSTELDEDVRKWQLRGFSTSDPHIISGLKEVFLKFLQLNAAVYVYECNDCKGRIYMYERNENEFIEFELVDQDSPLKMYLFDHDLMTLDFQGQIKLTDLKSTPQIGCPDCKKMISQTLVELKDISDNFIFNSSKMKKITEIEYFNELTNNVHYNVGKALFKIAIGEAWND